MCDALEKKTTHMRIIKFMLVMAILTGGAVRSKADSIDVEKLTDTCVVGESLYLKVTVHLDEEKPIDVSGVQLNGTPLRYNENQSSSSSFSFTINGRTIKQSSGIEKSYVFEIPGTTVGDVVLPRCTIRIGDESYTIDSQTFKVVPKPVSDDFLLETRLVSPLSSYYPTQTIEMACALYFTDQAANPSDLQYDLPILENNDFQYLPPDTAPKGYVIINGKKFGIVYDQTTTQKKGKPYNLFSFRLRFRLMKSGTYTFRNSIKAQVDTGRLMRQRGFFGSELVRERKTVYADSLPMTIHVNTLPRDNVPDSYNGAIGDFKIKVIPSSDTDIKVGDPITLAIEISGRGSWEFVKCPPVNEMEEITDYFIVSSDPVAGEVSSDHSRKTFLVRMRVKSKTIKQIPAIPFTFFNLNKGKYVTVYSDPVDISVFDATGNVEIVDFGAQEAEKSVPDAGKPGESDAAKTPPSPGAEKAPDLPERIPIRDNVGGSRLLENHSPDYGKAWYAVIPLILIAIIWFLGKVRHFSISDARMAQIKQRTAYRIFQGGTSGLQGTPSNGAEYYRELSRHILLFIENRFGVKTEDIDQDVIKTLREKGKLSTELGEHLGGVFERIQDLRYTRQPFDADEAKSILKSVKEVLKQC